MGAPDFILGGGTGQGVVPSIGIEALIRDRDHMLETFEKAIATLRLAEDIGEASGLTSREYHGFDWIAYGPDRNYRDPSLLQPDALAGIRKRADAAAWDLLMRQSGLMSLMDATARKEWRDNIEKCETPALTKDNVAATFASLYEDRTAIFERGVVNCFKKLSWDYKTNQPFKFGKRIIKYIRSYGHFAHERVDELVDLQRVFCILDGKPEEDHRNGLYQRLGSRHGEWRGTHDDTYMFLRWFKNGNAHITFKRPDLVAHLNRIIAKHFPGALPAPQDE